MKHDHPPKCKNLIKRSKKDPSIRDRYMNKLHRWDAKRTDSNLKFCPNCNCVWEQYLRVKVKYEYYPIFPKLGKEKKICPKCL